MFLFLFLFLFIIISYSYSQPNEGEIVRFEFVKVQKGDIVIIISYAQMELQEAKSFKPTMIFPDENTNRLI